MGRAYLGRWGVFAFAQLPQVLDHLLFQDGILLLRPPVGDLGGALFPEMFFEVLALAFVRREECEKIFDAAFLEVR